LLICGIIAALFTLLAKKTGLRFLETSGLVKRNYAGKPVPTSAGIILVLAASFAVTITATCFAASKTDPEISLTGLPLVMGSCFVGFIDDVYGSHDSKGLRGHLQAFLKERRITTGLQKAVGIWLLAAFTVILSTEGPRAVFILDATLISLAANVMNLLDFRPGRSMKAFLVFFACLAPLGRSSSAGPVCAGLAGAVLIGLRDDLAERSMMGDSGANPLGAALGFWATVSFSLPVRAFLLLSLIGIHVYSERNSLSTAISKSPILSFLDGLGRVRK